jgi:cysteine desulfurase/selenocysteine lyase
VQRARDRIAQRRRRIGRVAEPRVPAVERRRERDRAVCGPRRAEALERLARCAAHRLDVHLDAPAAREPDLPRALVGHAEREQLRRGPADHVDRLADHGGLDAPARHRSDERARRRHGELRAGRPRRAAPRARDRRDRHARAVVAPARRLREHGVEIVRRLRHGRTIILEVVDAQLEAWRREVPALARTVHGRRLAYLDSAARALAPQAVIDAVTRAMTHEAGNVGRGVHALAEAATDAYEGARAIVARFVGAAGAGEIVFTSGTTAAINLVAQAWGRAQVGRGDAIVATALEHHSNLVPWQMLCEARGAELRIAPIDDHGRIDLAAMANLIDRKTKLVAVAHLSNVVGTLAPIAAIARLAHDAGALLLVDGAQAIAHVPVDVGALGCDFYAFSGHKLGGPTGIGALHARAEILDAMPPWQGGGGMVTSVGATASRYRAAPARFEAGTPNIAGAIGLGAAIEHARARDATAHEARLHARLISIVGDAGARILGAPEHALIAFTLDRAHAHDVATILDREGVAVRSGHHCAEPLHHRLGAGASVRASLAYYNGDDDLDQLARALARVREVLP